jgi:hypothetical protein
MTVLIQFGGLAFVALGVHVRDGREIELTRKRGIGDRPRGI